MLAIICGNSYALIISKGKISNHKEWSDEGIKTTISDVNFPETASMTKAIHQDIGFNKKTNESIGIANLVNKTKGIVNQQTKIVGDVKTYIENFTPATQVYFVESMLCASFNNNCAHTLDTIELASGGKMQSRKTIEISYAYKKTGDTLVYIATWVKRNGSSTLVETDNVSTMEIVRG